MSHVIAIHGSAGSGKSTLVRVIKEHLGSQCSVIEENLDEFLATPSTLADDKSWFFKTTAIISSDNVTKIMMNKINPLLITIVTFVVYWLFSSLWPIMIILIICFSFSRLCRWLNCHILSKMWLYNADVFYKQQEKSNSAWIWRDRTCVDIYTYCIMNQSEAVPLNFPKVLIEQTHATTVALILDRPLHIIEQHLTKRMLSSNTKRSMALATRLILLTKFPIRASIAALKLVDQWYTYMKVPVIKISEIDHRLSHNASTGDIEWNQHSIEVLLETIEQAIKHRENSSSSVNNFLMPWQNQQNMRLYR